MLGSLGSIVLVATMSGANTGGRQYIAAGMFLFGYALIPIYRHICELTGINILALGEKQVPGGSTAGANSQVDASRTITVTHASDATPPTIGTVASMPARAA